MEKFIESKLPNCENDAPNFREIEDQKIKIMKEKAFLKYKEHLSKKANNDFENYQSRSKNGKFRRDFMEIDIFNSVSAISEVSEDFSKNSVLSDFSGSNSLFG